jgi:NAD-reducing hydrogenase large subunit
MIPGGLIYIPSQKNIVMAQKYFQKVIFNVEWIIEKFIELFSNRAPPEDFALPNPTFLGLHNDGTYDRYLGVLGIKQNLGTIENFSVNDYMNYFYKDIDLRGINFYKGENMVVGPLARKSLASNYGMDEVAQYLSYFDENWKRNVLFTNFLKLIEIYIEAHQGLEILDDPILNNKQALPSLKNIKNYEGIGVVEAPRGTLLHHYRLNENNSIDQVKLFIATEINLPMINMMITNYAQKLYEKRDISEVKEKVQRIIRAFDPCISCATH